MGTIRNNIRLPEFGREGDKMTEKVRQYMMEHHMVDKGDRIVLGVSGGVDSVALLLMLSKVQREWDLTLHVVHVHHGIRKEAEQDVKAVCGLCERLEVPCYVFYDDVPELAKQEKMSEEEMGRICRYRHFAEVAQQVNAGTIAVAHHMDDQAETVLFHLIRGSQLAGMRGMLPVSEWKDAQSGSIYKMIRPFLDCRKEELTAYVARKQEAWNEDDTNRENAYSRNRLRNKVLPEMQSINAQAVAHIAEFAKQASEYENFLQSMVNAYIEQNVEQNMQGNYVLDRKQLRQQEAVLIRSVLYRLICMAGEHKKDITTVHVQTVAELLDAQTGKICMLPYGVRAVTSYEKLIIGKCFEKETEQDQGTIQILDLNTLKYGEEQRYILDNGSILSAKMLDFWNMTEDDRENLWINIRNSKNNYTKFFGCDTIKSTLYIRKPMENDYLTIDEDGNRKKLRRYFIDAKIPEKQRMDVPVIACDNDILWIVGVRRSEGYRVYANTKYILELRYEGVSDELSY